MPRGSKGPELVVIYWRDIPAQVNAQIGRERHQVLLSDKFQRAVDRAKRKAHIDTAAEDVAQWRRQSRPCDGDPAAAAEALAARIEDEFTRERLGLLAFAGGWEAEIGTDRVHAAGLAALEELEEENAAEQDAMSTSDVSDK
jgi:cvfA/B/C family virulence factor